MTINRFLWHIKYGDVCPNGIHPRRWLAMISQYKLNKGILQP